MPRFVSYFAPMLLQTALLVTGGVLLGRVLRDQSDLPLGVPIAILVVALVVMTLRIRADNRRLAKIKAGAR